MGTEQPLNDIDRQTMPHKWQWSDIVDVIVGTVAEADAAAAAATAAHIDELRTEITLLREELQTPAIDGSGPDHRP